MKVVTPEISWHGKDAIFSIDVQCVIKRQPRRFATAGLDTNIRIWQLKNLEVTFLSNLSRHEKAVNIVRFSKKSLMLASAGDDGTIILWQLSDKEDIPNIFDSEDGSNVEKWNAIKILRGHLEDINDLSWSHDDSRLVSGSVDHTAILWDIEKGQKLAIFTDSKHFVNGVAWDPLDRFVATMSCDRSLRIYNIQTKKMTSCVNKMVYNKPGVSSETPTVKSQRIFHDETVVRRRLSFTVDGKMLITPAGCLQPEVSSPQINTAMIFSRANLSKPCVFLPGLKEPACVVSCCPVVFELRKTEEASMFKLDYRHIFAVASSDSVVMYDTQQSTPFALISNIHYASITDISWSPDASFLAISSRDGFCSIVRFDDDELGKPVPLKQAATKQNEAEREETTPLTKTTNPPIIISSSHLATDQNNNKKSEIIDEPMETESGGSSEKSRDVASLDKKSKVSKSPKPRRVSLATVAVTPGGNSPLADKEVPVKPPSSTPRRIQLISLSK